MQRIKLTLAYDGSRYSGWQRQLKEPEPPTIQGALEKALERVVSYRIPVYGSGRTDAGVHAEGQVCHFDCPPERAGMDWKHLFNSVLDRDISVLKVEKTRPDFHAQKNALSKIYSYSCWSASEKALPRIAPYCWHTPKLDKDAMCRAADYIVGKKDFAVFQNSGTEILDTVRTISSIDFRSSYCGGFDCPKDWPVWTCIIQGDGFLRHMVRNIMGFLVWAGQGKLDAEDILGLIESADRGKLPSPTAPAQGLCLLKVFYPD